MRVFLYLLFIFLYLGCQAAWYRRLPNKLEDSSHSVMGVWKKKTNPRSAVNSSWHQNQWSEKIFLQSDRTFIKTYESEDLIGNTRVHRKIEGKGSYITHKSWILLKTETLNLIEKRDSQLTKNWSKGIDSSLLYYYYKDGNLIIPMIYDMGYNEKEFGVKDGVSVPYDDTNSNFFRYIKIYAFKEFQSHAYYPEN